MAEQQKTQESAPKDDTNGADIAATEAFLASDDDTLVSKTDDSDDDDGIPAEEGIEELRRTLEAQKRAVEEERRLRMQAEQQAYEARVFAQQRDFETKKANYYQIKGAIAQIEEHDRSLMAEWAEAKSMGDYQREAEIQKALFESSANVRSLRMGQETLERELRIPVQPVAPPQIDEIEAAAQTMSPQSADWVRSHRDFLSSHQNKQLAQAAHLKAQGLGVKVDTPEYFEFVETELGLRKASRQAEIEEDDGDDGVMSAASAPAPRRSVAPPSAPVSRGGSRRGTVTLSKEEREAAKIAGVTEDEYVRQQQAIKNGKRRG